MSLRVDPEETAALTVFAELGRVPGANDTRVTAAEDEVEEVLRRLNLEGLALFAWALDPARPAPESRDELLARVSADSTQEVVPVEEPSGDGAAGAAPASSIDPIAPRPASAAPERPSAAPATAIPFAGRAAGRRRSRWAVGLAAALGLIAVGLGVAASWLASELSSERYRLARLEGEMSRVRSEQADQIARLREEVASLEQRRQFAAGPASLVFPLRPPRQGPQPLARGKLWVAADHQHWQLEVAGLAPTPEGREYQVWFMVDGIPLDGGCFRVEPGRTAALADAEMPAGTEGVAITLERAGGARAPTSTILLEANRAVEL
ncbi:MAG TPA: anti-sigma factor [Thermoanaerobaculia bacterium]|nr:anti-sigma factor [Thermoanaerobaculia bacterium]